MALFLFGTTVQLLYAALLIRTQNYREPAKMPFFIVPTNLSGACNHLVSKSCLFADLSYQVLSYLHSELNTHFLNHDNDSLLYEINIYIYTIYTMNQKISRNRKLYYIPYPTFIILHIFY